jgi:hypothetical protein
VRDKVWGEGMINEPDKEFNAYDPEVSEEDFGKWVDQQIEKMRKRREGVTDFIQSRGVDPNTDENIEKWETLEKETREHYWSQRQSIKTFLEGRDIDDDGSPKAD